MAFAIAVAMAIAIPSWLLHFFLSYLIINCHITNYIQGSPSIIPWFDWTGFCCARLDSLNGWDICKGVFATRLWPGKKCGTRRALERSISWKVEIKFSWSRGQITISSAWSGRVYSVAGVEKTTIMIVRSTRFYDPEQGPIKQGPRLPRSREFQ